MNGDPAIRERPALTKHQKAVAEAVVTALKPLLMEINRKLDEVLRKLDAMAERQDDGLAYLERLTGRDRSE
jgi:hypothetical protein